MKSFCLWLFPTKPLEVREAIDQLDKKTSPGLDDICNLVVKSCSESLAPILAELINNSFKTGIFPEDLKRPQVIPLHKWDSKADLNNYRPISLLIVFSKIFERIMCNRIYHISSFSIQNNLDLGKSIQRLMQLQNSLSGCERIINQEQLLVQFFWT